MVQILSSKSRSEQCYVGGDACGGMRTKIIFKSGWCCWII